MQNLNRTLTRGIIRAVIYAPVEQRVLSAANSLFMSEKSKNG
jgi:hypothetical protein